MALLHSRVRRVIFGVSDTQGGGLGGINDRLSVHSLPGTNHHFRVFRCNSNQRLWEECHKLLSLTHN